MKRLILLFCTVSALSQPLYDCRADGQERWNRFVNDANPYAKRRLWDGVVDARDEKVRERLNREWQALQRCQCW